MWHCWGLCVIVCVISFRRDAFQGAHRWRGVTPSLQKKIYPTRKCLRRLDEITDPSVKGRKTFEEQAPRTRSLLLTSGFSGGRLVESCWDSLGQVHLLSSRDFFRWSPLSSGDLSTEHSCTFLHISYSASTKATELNYTSAHRRHVNSKRLYILTILALLSCLI